MAYVGRHGGDTSEIVGWQPNPLVRGTAEILTSCLITLSLCVWSALHLNVKGSDGKYARIWAKIFWAVLCLFAPEVIVALAWNQRKEAKALAQHMNEELNVPPPKASPSFFSAAWTWIVNLVRRVSTKNKEEAADAEVGASTDAQVADRKHRWTTKHGFFARMGGFGLNVPVLPHEIRFFPKKEEERFLVTPLGIKFLVSFPEAHKDIPDLSEEHIQSYSSADSFAKFLVCWQALWFCAQTIARLAQRLPISLLELNTFAHAVCVLVSLVLWWYEKPFEIARPFYFDSRFLHPAAAAARLSTHTSSVTGHWLEHAKSYLDDQEARFGLVSNYIWIPRWDSKPCVNLSTYIQRPGSDIEVLSHSGPEEPDKEAFRQFCARSNLQDADEVIATATSLWEESGESPGYRYLRFVPQELFNDLSPLFIPGYPCKNSLVTFGVLCLQSKFAAPFDLPVIWTNHYFLKLLGLLVPQVHEHFKPRNRRPEDMSDIFQPSGVAPYAPPWLGRAVQEDSAALEIASLPQYTQTNAPSLSVEAHDARLLQTAWQHVQLGSPNLLQKKRLNEWSSSEVKWDSRSLLSLGMPLVLATAIYGCFHLLGRNAVFEPPVLKTLWEVALIVVAGGFPVLGLITWVGMLRKYHTSSAEELRGSLGFFMWTNLVMFVSMAYVVARLYLVGVSFMALGHQPQEVYEVRSWASYWPQIS